MTMQRLRRYEALRAECDALTQQLATAEARQWYELFIADTDPPIDHDVVELQTICALQSAHLVIDYAGQRLNATIMRLQKSTATKGGES